MEQRLDRLAQRVADTGLAAIQFIAFIGQAVRLILQSFHLLIRGPSLGQPVRLRHVVEEIITAGIQSLPVVVLMAATIGIMLSIQGIHSLRIFGAETQVSFGLALSIPREFAPLITGTRADPVQHHRRAVRRPTVEQSSGRSHQLFKRLGRLVEQQLVPDLLLSDAGGTDQRINAGLFELQQVGLQQPLLEAQLRHRLRRG